MELKIKAAIFDMDGLLIDSEPLWREATIKVMSEVGIQLTYEQCKETMGYRVDEFVKYWLVKYKKEGEDIKKLSAQIVKEVISLIKTKGRIMDGVHEIIDLLYKEGIILAIASSSAEEIINAVVEKIGIKDKIKFIYSAEHEEFGKPHPGVYITAAKKLNVFVNQCLAFEDSPNGVLSAKAAKMKCVVIPDYLPASDKRYGIADLIVKSLKDFTLEDLKNI